MSEKLRVGVVGVGYLGRFHALIYSRMSNVELVGVADINRDVARSVAEECGCEAFELGKDLLGKVDAVSIVVPTTHHLDEAQPFLENGVHMLLEKPIAATVEEGREIVRLAEEAGVVLQVGHLERFNAGVMALADRIVRPRFIEAHRMGGFVARATDVDVVSDLMIHDIDIILSLVKSEITSISAVGTPVLTAHVDIANVRLEFANGTVANVIASRVSEKQTRRIRVFEENRYESLDFIAQRIETAYPKSKPGEEWPEVVVEQLEVEPVKPLDAELAAFVDCVNEGIKPLVDGHTGQEALEVAMRVKAEIMGRLDA
ncbi:Gfo/Idh/MocA family protein [Solemya velesiana gill symbiont]|uniref:Oxidoreductase n=1 Tax=Solemya velesiana gill symbiont TaxID=1918948 RepID=A0A1T2KY82_9GAMM|nr:Gfo/Idh/MocA family oxidoreductase [Solemya velesiana gill symbiont]OOZ37819.1 oxidoreductase [Solemya velesiana gill symbiont]